MNEVKRSTVQTEYEELCRLINSAEVISFDIYDTALLRNVLQPTDLFEIVERTLVDEQVAIKKFKSLRMRCERKARERSVREDITLDDIYNVMAEKVGTKAAAKAKEIELTTESEFTVANPFIKRVFEYAQSMSKDILFISDMYLPASFIRERLISSGYGSFKGLYVSGEIGLSKGSGLLYTHVRQYLRKEIEWLHIGDNEKSDYLNAKAFGIKAYHYIELRKRVELRKKYSLEYSIMKAIQINYSETAFEMSYWKRFGIQVVSSLFYGFMMWLTEQLRGKDNVYFLSRDGYLPYLLYEKFRLLSEDLPKANYLYASRRAYLTPNTLNLPEHDAMELLTSYNERLGQTLTVGEVFDNLHLDKNSFLETIRQHGFHDYSDGIKDDSDRTRIKSVLKVIYPAVRERLEMEKQSVLSYLSQNDWFTHDEVNIVDVGWAGSTQKSLKDLSGIRVNGFYFGTSYNVYPDIVDQVKAYAFQIGKPQKLRKSIMENVMMYEFIFSAPHGSLTGFEMKDRKSVPVIQEIEHNSRLYEIIKELQNGVLEIAERYMIHQSYLRRVAVSECLFDYMHFIVAKRYEDLVEFKVLSSVVGIGAAQTSQNFVSSMNVRKYSKLSRKLKNEMKKNLWPDAVILHGSLTEFKMAKLKGSTYPITNLRLKEKLMKAFRNPKKAMQRVKHILRG